MTLLDFQLIIIITVTLQVAVLTQFSWNSRGWCESTYEWSLLFMETIGPIELLTWGKMCPQKLVFAFIQLVWGFWVKNFKAVFGTPFTIEKVIFIFVAGHPIPWKCPCPQKFFFAVILENIVLFFFKLLYDKYSKS